MVVVGSVYSLLQRRPQQQQQQYSFWLRSIRHWWTQSNIQALHISQDQLLKSCIETPYVYTSHAGMNSVEFTRNNNNNLLRSNPVVTSTSDASSLESSVSNNNNNNCCRCKNYHNRNNHDRRFFRTVQRRTPSVSTPCSSCCGNNINDNTTVIITHGFGSGLGFFYKNVDLLFQNYSHVNRVVLVDWFGMGGSDRPIYSGKRRFPLFKSSTVATTNNTQQAVDFFIEPFYEWFQTSIIERQSSLQQPQPKKKEKEQIVLVGHSLGGYLCGQYAIQHPQHLSKLVLASPVGFSYNNNNNCTNQPPNSTEISNISSSTACYQHQFSENFYTGCSVSSASPSLSATDATTCSDVCITETQNGMQESVTTTTTTDTPTVPTASSCNKPIATPSISPEAVSTTSTSTTSHANNNDKRNTIAAVMPSSRKTIIRVLSTLWRSNVTPQQLIRMCGATHGRANVYRKLRQKLGSSTTASTNTGVPCVSSRDNHEQNETSLDHATQSPPPKQDQLKQQQKLHSDNDIHLLADYLYHITVADPSGEFAMNALLEPTLVTIPVTVAAAAASTQESQEESTESVSAKTIFTNSSSPPQSYTSESSSSSPFSASSDDDEKAFAHGGGGSASSLLFEKSRIPSYATMSSPSPKNIRGTDKTFSAMGVSAREPLQELLAQTLDTSYGLHSVKVLYGSHDWMRPNEIVARQSLQQLHFRTGITTSVNVVPNAGHHFYMESPIEFVRHIMN